MRLHIKIEKTLKVCCIQGKRVTEKYELCIFLGNSDFCVCIGGNSIQFVLIIWMSSCSITVLVCFNYIWFIAVCEQHVAAFGSKSDWENDDKFYDVFISMHFINLTLKTTINSY